MKKTIKKISVILLSAIMTVNMSLAVSASCAHLSTYLTNKRLSDRYTSQHTFNLYNSKGVVIGTESCTVSHLTFEYTKRCNNCGASCGYYYEYEDTHMNSHCPEA